MQLDFFTLDKLNTYPLVEGVVIHPLKVNQDPRGILVESLKADWTEIFDQDKRPFTQMYYSITKPGTARDEDKWHYHPGGQEDRFGVIKGEIVVAIFDNKRKDSPTKGRLNLFLMGDGQKDKGQYLLLVPPRTLHGFVVVGKQEAVLFNYPTRLYDPKEEVRIPFEKEKLTDGSVFSWEEIRSHFK